ncbi:winged helix-turn-helix domain-containing protein [Streptomyces sp. DH37]|uniref:winged helix-turn-helix domain-containing protein n=1 Tax=Streptomyces sp. DH37 TaxID=3040122 RepID=UPI0024421026|nr:winged helix-turn-helix domain-containing protein [Streptomyces sp. DH37]MDG9700789.1 winged helix-turn-helix domain-containing protein [Streptomyces sp. DH37]
MTVALPARALRPDTPLPTPHRPRPVREEGPDGVEGGDATPLVGYLLFLPEDVDPAALLTASGLSPRIRPVARDDAPSPVIRGDDLVHIDTARHVAEVEGRELDLTFLEFALLARLVAHPHRVHSREHLVNSVWGHTHVGDGRTVDVHVARLRRKLGAAHRHRIVTVRRVGYKYVPGPR